MHDLAGRHEIPNGEAIFARLVAVRGVVPVSASHVTVDETPAPWLDGCSQTGEVGRSGWGTDEVAISFHDAASYAVVLRGMDHALEGLGWRRHDVAPGPHQGRVAHWTLDVHEAKPAQAFAFRVGPSERAWYVSASWHPPGPRGQGCA